jgi:FeS assembly SUF system protein
VEAPQGEGLADAARAGDAPPPDGPVDTEAIERGVVDALRKVYDPEIPVNIYELGLIYEVRVSPEAVVDVRMTLTAPNCPAAGILPGEVEASARRVPGVRDVHLELTFDPPWSPDMMSDAARLELGML